MMKSILRTACLAWGMALSLAVHATEFTQIQKDSIFGASPNNATTYWMYVADSTETLTMIAQQTTTGTGIPRPFSDEELETAISISPGYIGGYYQYQLNVQAGTTYYFKLVATWADSAYYILQSEAGGAATTLQVTSTNPTEFSTLSLTGSGTVTFYCNLAFTCDATATMQSGHMVNDTLEVNLVSSTCSAQVEFKDALMEWLQDGHVQEGDTVTFTFTGIASVAHPDSLLSGDGTLTLAYIAPSMPTQLIEQYIPESFLSYWLPDDADGTLRLVFDGELASATAYLTYGERDTEGEYYYETLTAQIDSNEILIDLTDHLRNPSTLLASGTLYESVYIKVGSVVDINGNSTYSSDQGSVGSYSFNLPYSDISANFATEWLPADGKDIASKSNCELYISKSGVVLYDAFIFTFQRIDSQAIAFVNDTVLVAVDEVKAEAEDDGIVYTFAFPDEVKAGYNVTLTLDALQYTDGIYSDERTDMLTVTYNPATDAELAALLETLSEAMGIRSVASCDDALLRSPQDVHTLAGGLVRSNATTLEGLPEGIYIVGGQKVCIGK